MKTKTISLRANGSTMHLYAIRKGEADTSYVTVTDANKQTQRGLTEQLATFDQAVARIGKRADEATRIGWERPSLRRFDLFDGHDRWFYFDGRFQKR